jgi:phosphatidylglycerophosphatase A
MALIVRDRRGWAPLPFFVLLAATIFSGRQMLISTRELFGWVLPGVPVFLVCIVLFLLWLYASPTSRVSRGLLALGAAALLSTEVMAHFDASGIARSLLTIQMLLLAFVIAWAVLFAQGTLRHLRLRPHPRREWIAEDIATILGAGYFRVATGTLGALIAFGASCLTAPLAWPIRLAIVFISLMVGLLTTHLARAHFENDDPGEVVVDEWIGHFVATLFVPQQYAWLAAAFFAFRVFDIGKPWPIRRVEKLHGAWGVILDDVVAGIFAGAILTGIRYLWFW